MDTDDLPNDFDVIILGTGLTETIAAASFSRIGLKVLHLDRNNYYGGSYANFNLQGIEEWKQNNEKLAQTKGDSHAVTEDLKQLAGEGQILTGLAKEAAHANNIKINFHVRKMTAEERVHVEMLRPRTVSRSIAPVELSEFTITVDQSSPESSTEDFKRKCSIDNTTANTNTADKTTVAPQTTTSNNGDSEEKGAASTTTEEITSVEKKDDANSGSDNKATTDDQTQEEATTSNADPFSPTISTDGKTADWTVEGIQEDWRKFCFDISPRVLYCSGDLVELLIQSDVARYCEFRTVSRVLTILKGALQQVPCSRADVFSSKIVSLIEKRLMMKFLQFAADFENHPEDYESFKGKPFVEFIKSKKLTANVQHFVQHAIAMVNDSVTTEEALKRTQVFLRSLGRYGNTAFLFSLYGSGELPQAFSRLSAVFGGTYCLMMSASHIIADRDNRCCGIISTKGKKINCKYLVAEASYLPEEFLQFSSKKTTSRAIFITNKSIKQCDEPELSMLNFVCEKDADKPISLMELPPSACVCPKGLYVVHLTREGISSSPESDFTEVLDKLFSSGEQDCEDKPTILWSLYFNHDDLSQVSLQPGGLSNVFVTPGGGDGCIDMETCVKQAKAIFHQVCPDEEFLSKPPNPEDIIYVDDTEAAIAKGPGEFELGEGEGEGEQGVEKKNEDGEEEEQSETQKSEEA